MGGGERGGVVGGGDGVGVGSVEEGIEVEGFRAFGVFVEAAERFFGGGMVGREGGAGRRVGVWEV